ncbi:nucleoside recognition protein [Deferribacter autotrophicus]|uniref:Nucleoside recognition protein n=1 Tax=Deferribacter autotrophicus TaxID=500465 RepID=A0A5A8F4U4_9BACT|nr:nucleoside recognition domain-containing protein [Deferribacter autotrophicus]KAA0257672.1 nucleoside recognition protein [Deferribacter autotrophicus]
MNIFVKHILDGLKKGINISGKIVIYTFPFYILIDMLKQSGVLMKIGNFFEPITALMGLPGEATIVLLSGFLINLYPALASMAAMDLTAKQITIIGIVLGIAHNLIIEGIVLSKSGVRIYITVFFRLILAIITGIGVNIIWNFLS